MGWRLPAAAFSLRWVRVNKYFARQQQINLLWVSHYLFPYLVGSLLSLFLLACVALTPLCSRHWTLNCFCHFLQAGLGRQGGQRLSVRSQRFLIIRMARMSPGGSGGSRCCSWQEVMLTAARVPDTDPSCVILSTEDGHWQLSVPHHYKHYKHSTLYICTVPAHSTGGKLGLALRNGPQVGAGD